MSCQSCASCRPAPSTPSPITTAITAATKPGTTVATTAAATTTATTNVAQHLSIAHPVNRARPVILCLLCPLQSTMVHGRFCSNREKCTAHNNGVHLTDDNFRKGAYLPLSNKFFRLCNHCQQTRPCPQNFQLSPRKRCSDCGCFKQAHHFQGRLGI